MSETARAPVDVFEKARTHDRLEQLEAAKEARPPPLLPPATSQAGPVVEMEGRETIMLGSNNYLGLTGDERVKQAARDALETYGTGAHRLAPAERDDAAAPRPRARARGVDADRGRDRLHHRLPGERRLHRHDPRARRHRRSATPATTPRSSTAAGSPAPSSAPSATTGWTSWRGCWSARREDGGGVLVVVDGVFSMEGDVCAAARDRRALRGATAPA